MGRARWGEWASRWQVSLLSALGTAAPPVWEKRTSAAEISASLEARSQVADGFALRLRSMRTAGRDEAGTVPPVTSSQSFPMSMAPLGGMALAELGSKLECLRREVARPVL